MKSCTWCKLEKPFDRFYPLRKGHHLYQTTCKDCQAERKRDITKRRKATPVIVPFIEQVRRAQIRAVIESRPVVLPKEPTLILPGGSL